MIVYVTVIAFCLMNEPCQYYVGDKPHKSETACVAAAKALHEHFVESLRTEALKAGYAVIPPMKIGHGCKKRESA